MALASKKVVPTTTQSTQGRGWPGKTKLWASSNGRSSPYVQLLYTSYIFTRGAAGLWLYSETCFFLICSGFLSFYNLRFSGSKLKNEVRINNNSLINGKHWLQKAIKQVVFDRVASQGNTPWVLKQERCSQNSPAPSTSCYRETSPEKRLAPFPITV